MNGFVSCMYRCLYRTFMHLAISFYKNIWTTDVKHNLYSGFSSISLHNIWNYGNIGTKYETCFAVSIYTSRTYLFKLGKNILIFIKITEGILFWVHFSSVILYYRSFLLSGDAEETSFLYLRLKRVIIEDVQNSFVEI